MDNLQVTLPFTSTSKSAAPKYTFKSPFRQSFSIPYPIIKYMIENPQSGNVWKKLITSCKYFYSKYPVLPVKTLDVYKMKCEADGEILDSFKPFPKLWLYDNFSAFSGSNISALITKVFKFDLRILYLYRQSLKFHDYLKLTSSGSFNMLHLTGCEIKNADGTIVTADKLLENLEHLKSLTMVFPNPLMFQPDTVKKMVQLLKGYENMRSLFLVGMKETFYFSSFLDFLMKNETVDVRFFYRPPVSAAYKEMVENAVKEIKKNHSLKIPDIRF